MKCLICDRDIKLDSDGRAHCYCCKSHILLDDKGQLQIEKNNVPFNREIFISGVLSLLGMIAAFIFFISKGAGLFPVGLLYIIGPLIGLFQHSIYYKSTDFQNYLDLHKALISRRLKYYDFGSRFFIYSLLLIQIVGFILILMGIFFNI